MYASIEQKYALLKLCDDGCQRKECLTEQLGNSFSCN